MDSLAPAQIENFNGVITECTNKQSVAGGIELHVVDATLDARQPNRVRQLKCLRLGMGGRRIKAKCHKQDLVQKTVSHLLAYVKSSNSVMLSALVQTPTLPAFLNVSSSHSIAFFPSNVTVK